ncbi:MAG: hypothetical protein OEY94_04265 [Alphaproteobacteria bacterium]|nr:hypothetical protein [Alphaproteobacteria bacterium]
MLHNRIMTFIFKNSKALAALLILCGLLYIPAFIYGYFWLWIVPFTAIMVLFLRAMIDNAIARVSQKGDAAVQAKAMIPEFLMINVFMTALLSLPFILVLWLSHSGAIQVLHQSEFDKSLWRFCLWIMREPNAFEQTKYAQIQITLSNMFFMIFATFALFLTSFKKIKQVFLILFHRESYKFLRSIPSSGSSVHFLGLACLAMFVFVFLMPINPIPSMFYTIGVCLFMNFMICALTECFQTMLIVSKMQGDNL